MSVHRRFYRNAKGKRVPRPNYYVKLWDAEKGKPVWHVGSPDRRDTQALELALIDEREAKRAGTAPPAPSGETGLESHVAAYESHLAKKNDSPAYVSLTGSRVRAILAACEFTKVTDVAAGPVLDYLRSRLTRPDRPCPPIDKPVYTLAAAALLLGAHPHSLSAIVRREGLEVTGNGRARRYPAVTVAAMQAVLCRGSAVGTVNAYLTAFRGFTAWLANPQVGRAAVDPMRGVKRFRVSREDERVRRRFMSADELTAILDAAGASKRPYRGMSGPARRMIYLVGMSTGFRCSELASMSAGSFALEASPPVAAVRAGYTKNKRAATQPLPADVAEAVRAYLHGREGPALLWPGSWCKRGADMLRVDLAAAGIAYRDEEGRQRDFHALRHSYITAVVSSGASIKVAQGLARHSTSALTLDRYAASIPSEMTAAVNALPSVLNGSKAAKPSKR